MILRAIYMSCILYYIDVEIRFKCFRKQIIFFKLVKKKSVKSVIQKKKLQYHLSHTPILKTFIFFSQSVDIKTLKKPYYTFSIVVT